MSLMLWLMLQLLLWWFIYEWEEETHLQDFSYLHGDLLV